MIKLQIKNNLINLLSVKVIKLTLQWQNLRPHC